MLFSSPTFLFLFLPILLGGYFLVRDSLLNLLLLLASLIFYIWGEGTYVLVMLGIIGLNYALGRALERIEGPGRRKLLLAAGVVINLGILVAFKYANFLVNNLNVLVGACGVSPIHLEPVHLPLGISFFTFHAISYIVDISRRQVAAGGPLNFALYMTFFPHSIAGPIVRYSDIAGQLRKRVVTSHDFALGARRFILGLAKKMLIANPVAQVADTVFGLPGGELTAALSWLGIACYTLQIYFDFSGYSDMAIGLAKLFGIDFLENFDHPYLSQSVTEFWRRWHISLSSWFRDYVYIPLGGNRRGSLRLYANLLVVFCLCGMWHGASWNFLLWGLFHGGLLAFERVGYGRRLETRWVPLRHAYTMLMVMIGWVLFRADSMEHAGTFLRAMAGLGTGTGRVYHPALYLDRLVILAMVAGVLGSMPLLAWLARTRDDLLESTGGWARSGFRAAFALADVAALSLLFLASSMFLAAGTHNPFIYFRF
ncbi:Peptidoglycan O-acetyltransferase [Aquisphaera giovannonii]|uniref:Peptidoglycan O-acetyltransferase n=1 Tax=Aquisphaera giovannonii TaxID=406548 RepID=A0A5B9VV70_9BACT|nr:MBOAT family O-acyltransferase [Aquisphaera giovannonii]QEH31655.1 Peptidoglycan O-acetyltransferase [Aquisphaera giovannonii]